MAASSDQIIAELDRLLEPQHFADYCANGLQVPGPDIVTRIATGVSAHAELFERAAQERAQLLIVHHGLFWGEGFRVIDSTLKRRLALLFEADIGLAAYHLPLDAHPELGNNALIARALGAERLERFALHHDAPIGILAAIPEPGLAAPELFAHIAQMTAREPLIFDEGPQTVRTLAIVSGAGADYLRDAADAGADAFLTGEPAERVMAEAREAGVHFIAAGHYATETFGVRHLGEHLARRFELTHTFLDVPNPV
jgi:dinuclear metal center YbgI/SA1388 family protein